MRSMLVSPLSALRSPLSALGASSAGAGRTLAACLILPLVAMAQAQEVYSTHDSTSGLVLGGEPIEDYREAWADVKSPGDNRHYAVGTITVRDTQLGAQFSGVNALVLVDPMLGLPVGFTLGQGASRQVVIVQCTDATPEAAGPGTFQQIFWQRYLFGGGQFLQPSAGASNARAISVWPGETEAQTRIAICGETYDIRLPGSPDAFLAATAQAPTGFISVLDGGGNLLWTRHFFGNDPTQSCAITDVSIRVEPDGRETVTYCGISTHGDPGPGTNLSPLRSGAATASQLPGVWGGIVGRVSRVGAAIVPEFHAATALPQAWRFDAALGLAEVQVDYTGQTPVDLFAVVGTVGLPGLPGTMGILQLFEASATRLGTAPADLLSLEFILLYGDEPTGERVTIARDVVLQWDGCFDPVANATRHSLAIVGSTDDPGMFAGQMPPVVFGGNTDGFLAVARVNPPVAMSTWTLTRVRGQFFGGPGDDGFTGVNLWNECPDQIVAAGFTQGADVAGDFDIAVASYYLDTSTLGAAPDDLRLVRQAQIGGATPPSLFGTADERPAAMGTIQATAPGFGLPFPVLGLGDPAGGGVAVDQLGRVNVVGYTEAVDFPAPAPGRARDAAPSADAVRAVFDMLPPARAGTFGVGRTDLTGDQGSGFVLLAGLTGGTTPACALSPFGRRFFEPAPTLTRMLIDYEGEAPVAGLATPAALIISRPVSTVFTAWQWDIPGGAQAPPGLLLLPPLINGVEVFTPNAIALGGPLIFAGVGLPGHSIRVSPINFNVPAGIVANSMMVQVICWFPGLPQPGGLTCTGADTTEMVGSAGMWLPL